MTTLPHLYRHHRWATLTLIDHLAGRPAEDLDRRAPGGFGAIAETLTHMLYNEVRFIDVLEGRQADFDASPPPGPSLTQLRQIAVENSERLIAIAGRTEETDRLSGTFRGQPFDFPAYIPLFQAYHHGVEHRTNITSILATYDLPVPNIDLWSFNAAGEAS
ncbi:MAG: DinB family protein [Dehalococcoidia bacterium]|jgi:uncharacterized damage-inducible protein DinB